MKFTATYARYACYGLLMGFSLSRMGFADFAEAHAMFTFSDLRLFLSFGGGVALISAFFYLVLRVKDMPGKALHKGSIVGGIIFGLGWAITGACPSVVLVQIGEGQLAAFATLAGLLVGTSVYPKIHSRYFAWDMGSCSI